MSGLYPGYLNLVLIAFGALTYLALARVSDASVMHPKIRIDEIKRTKITMPSAGCGAASDKTQIFTKLYEHAVLYGDFSVPKTRKLLDFCTMNNFVLPCEIPESVIEEHQDGIKLLNVVLTDISSVRMLDRAFSTYSSGASRLLLMHMLGYVGVVRC